MADYDIKRLKSPKNTRIMLHSADPKLTVDHVTFWLEHLVDMGEPFSILVRDMGSFKKLTSRFPRLQICYAEAPVDVESVVNAHESLNVVLYTSNMPKNIHLLRFNHLRHIFIGTKNSDWLSSFNKSYRAYDEFWAGGEFVIDRFKEAIPHTAHLKFHIVGKPQLQEIFKKEQNSRKGLVLLFDSDESILYKVYGANRFFSEDIHILNKINKSTENKLKDILKVQSSRNNISFYEKNMIEGLVKTASYLITDIKNLTPYLLAYGIPILLYQPEKHKIDLPHYPEIESSLYLWHDAEELEAVLGKLAEGDDELKMIREEMADRFFNFKFTLNNEFAKRILINR